MHFEQEALYPLLSMAIAGFIYSLVATLGGSGFLAVYVAGLVIGNSKLPYRRFLIRFNSTMAWLAQIVMFVTLGLLVFPSQLIEVAGPGMAMTAFLMFAARPVATVPLLLLFRRNWRAALLVAWVGLRGAVPIILATLPRVAGVASAQLIFNVVFFVVVVSCLVQGTSIPYVAQWLRVAAPERVRRRVPIELVPHEAMDSDLMEIVVPQESPLAGKPVAQLGLPKETLIIMVGRNGRYRVPTGGTTVHGGDMLFVLGPPAVLEEVRARFERSEAETESDAGEELADAGPATQPLPAPRRGGRLPVGRLSRPRVDAARQGQPASGPLPGGLLLRPQMLDDGRHQPAGGLLDGGQAVTQAADGTDGLQACLAVERREPPRQLRRPPPQRLPVTKEADARQTRHALAPSRAWPGYGGSSSPP
ncbi:MAG: hypothetical protein GX496_07485, partial [Firmicutes bacterium]|nr:hypothetical protein [Bacillota bacterium]